MLNMQHGCPKSFLLFIADSLCDLEYTSSLGILYLQRSTGQVVPVRVFLDG